MFDPPSPEVEARGEGPVTLFLIQPSEGVFGKAAMHEWIQVTVPLYLDANDAPLWSHGGTNKSLSKRELVVWNLSVMASNMPNTGNGVKA